MFKALTSSPYFGIVLTIGAYMFANRLQKKAHGNPLLNPLLVAIILCIIFLKSFDIDYDNYARGGQYISFLIGPATVALVVNLYKNIDLLKKNVLAVFVGIFVGAVTSMVTVFLLSKLFKLDDRIIKTLLPKSLTTAIGVPLAEEYGGLTDITTIAIIVTGVTGSVIATTVMKILKIKDPVARGVGIGTSSHAVGTSKALQMGEAEGAMSGLSIALHGY